MASQKLRINFCSEDDVLKVCDKVKASKILAWRVDCRGLCEEQFLQCPRLHEAKELLSLFDFAPNFQGEEARAKEPVQGGDPILYEHSVNPHLKVKGLMGL